MDVGGLVGDGLRDDVADEADDGGVFIDDLFGLLGNLGGDVAVVGIFEGAGADAEGFDDELVNAFRDGEVPDERSRGEGADPVGDDVVGRPDGGEVQGRGGRVLDGRAVVGGKRDGDGLVLVGEAGREEAARGGIGGEVARDGEAGALGERGDGLGIGQPEERGEDGEAFAEGGLGEGQALLVGEAAGERFGKIGDYAGRRHAREAWLEV